MYFNKIFVALFLVFIGAFANAQSLSISADGETGTSGTNWSVSGSNPVVITATGTANVNKSVIESYLNSGVSVTVQCIVSNGEVFVSVPIQKTSGGDATLTLRSDKRVTTNGISSSFSKLNLILWSDYNNSNVGGVGITSSINTNGGHFWAGGSSSSAGSYTWNGLTVGNGPSVGSSSANHYAMDVFVTSITTGGGDILLWAGTGNGSTLDGIGLQNNPQLNAGSGNVTLITRQLIATSNTLSISSTGKLTLATDNSNPWAGDFTWSTTTSGANVTLTSAMGQPIQMNNFSSLGGLSLGVYDGYGSSFNYTNSQNVNVNSAIDIDGSISFVGSNVTVNNNLYASVSGTDLLLKATKCVLVAENVALKTNNGDITFWSNSDGIANSTDGDFIGLNQGVTINSANGLTNQASGGGTITLAGGTASQTLASGTIVPTGYAYSNRTTVWGDHVPSAVTFGRYTNSATYTNSLNIYSGGGDVVIKGQSANAVPGFAWYRGFTGATQNINSGIGSITITGDNTSTGHGIELSYFSGSGSVGPTITSSNTTSSAITVTGATSSTGTVAGYQGSATIIANAEGGGIAISGQTANTGTYAGIEASALYAYALSGPITLIANGGTGLRSGGVLGKGTLPSSSSNITLRSNSFSLHNAEAIQTTGTLTVEPLGTSFASALTFPMTNLTVPNTLTGLTVGKSGNTADITLSSAQSVAGAITVYGGTITQSAAYTTTVNTGHINFIGTGSVLMGANISTSGGSLVVWSDKDGNADGRVSFPSSVTTSGGNIYVGGGSSSETVSGLTVPTGYSASSNASFNGIALFSTTVNSGGGTIRMKGTVNAVDGSNAGIQVHGSTSISSGAGALSLYGQRTGNPHMSAGLFIGTTIDLSSSTGNVSISSTTGDIYLEGTTSGITTTYSWCHGLAIVEYAGDDVTISSTTGNINLTGNATNAALQAGEAVGFVIQSSSATSFTRINTDGGALEINGISGNTGGNYGASYRAQNVSGNIAFGDENTGNITLRFGSLSTSNGANVGTIAVQNVGYCVFEGVSGATFASAVSITTEFSIASTATSFRLGSVNNSADINFKPVLSIAGPISIYAGMVNIYQNITSTNAGDITLKGSTSFYTSGATQCSITTNGGNILVEADSDANGSGLLNIDYLVFNPGSGNTVIRGETMTFDTGSEAQKPWINGTGSFTLESNDGSLGQEVYLQWFKIDQDANGIGGLYLGKSTNTTNFNFTSVGALSIAGAASVNASNISFSTALSVSGDLSLKASGTVTQTASISATGISLSGAGSFTLSNTSNNFGTLAAGTSSSRIGALSLTDASGGLTIGTLGSISGIYSSGLVSVETLTGNISLTQPVSTTNTTSSALIINSGKSSAIDASEGGDIIVTGSPTITVGTGGIAKLFSGMESNSTGLTTLVGGSSNVRTGYDETSSSFSPTLSANNAYAIYRALEGEGDITIVTSGGHAEGTSWTYSNGVISTLTSPILINASDVVTKLADSDLSIEARTITFSTNIISSTPKNLKVLAKRHIVNSVATTITTQGGDVMLSSNVDDATDGESTNNGRIDFRYGLTITTNGGDITLAGGNTLGTGYALGQSGGLNPEGVRIDVTANLNSGNGNISIKGKSYSGAIGGGTGGSGVGFYYLTSNGNINSGSGSIVLDGYSQTSGSTFSSGIVFYNTTANLPFTIQSSSNATNAITINAFCAGTSEDAFGIETEAYSILNILAPSGGGIDINTGNSVANYYDIVFRAETNILSTGGPINLHGGQFGGASNGYLYIAGNLFLGSKSGVVSSSISDITISHDRFAFNGYTPKLATTGDVVIESNASSFGDAVYTSNFALNQNSQTMSSFRLGKTGSAADLYVNSAFTVAGPISVYGWNVDVTGNITSSADGDIFIKGISDWNDIEMTSTIAKTAGTGTLTIQANGRANFSGPITASGTGVLNVVIWSDYNGDNGDGGATFSGAITTNGGHVWMGGSNSNGGSYTWNGLTVGDGPSVGGSNANSLDFFNSVTTNGGDVFAWAGNGNGGVNGIASNGSWTVNAGSGDITFVSSVTSGTIGFTTTGLISLLPNGGSYASTLTIGGTTTSDVFTINTGHYNGLKINNLSTYGGLTIGDFSGFSGVTLSNSSDVTISSNLSAAGPISLYGGIVTLNANLTTTNNGDISIYSDSPIGGLSSQRNVTAAGTFKYIPKSNSFSSSVAYPITNLNLTCGGLQIGKSTNTAAVTVGTATTVAGPISIYGGAVTLTGGLTTTSTSTGDVTIKSSNLTGSGGLTVATGRILTMDLSATSSLPGTLTGTDIQFVKDGVGTLTLSNSYTFGGQSSVLGGTLRTNDITFSNLSVSSGANYILSSAKDITISGALVNNGSFKLENGASMLQTSATANTGTGTYTAERTMPGTGTSAPTGRFWYTGIPMTGATSGGFVAEGANKLWSHSEVTGLYSEITNDGTTLSQGVGYVFRGIDNTALNANTYAFTSNNIGNGDVTYNLTRSGSAPKPGFNLISNPYPSHVSWDQLYNSTVSNNTSALLPTVWYRSATSGGTMLFDTYNAVIGVGTSNSGGTSGNGTQVTGTIAPFQSFWVRLNTGTSLSMTATNAMRSHGTQSTLTLTPATVRLNISNGVLHDETLVVLNEDLSNSYDNNDSSKEIPSATIHQLYSLEGANKVAINGIGNALTKDTLQLGVQIPTAGTYSINCTEHTFSDIVYLEDKLTDEYIELSNTTAYSFTSEAGTFNSRFVLHFAPAPALPGQTPATAIAMSTSNWPQCNNVTSEDTWHAFTATTEGISIAVNTASADVIIELQDANGNAVAQENAVNGIGNETLNFYGLIAGQTYKVGVHNTLSGEPTGTYGICVKSLKRGGCDYGAGPYSLCQYYKATWAGSTGVSYTFTFTGTSGPAAGQTFTRTQNSDICVLSTVTPLLPYGSTYNVVISNTYTLTDGAGNTEQITVPSNIGCQVVTIAQPQTTLSNNSSCNNGPRFRGAVVSSMPWVCGSNNWRWRFTEVNPLTMQEVGLPIELNRGAASNYLNLGTVAQLQNGKTYAVQTAPIFNYTGTNYNWGPTQYLCIVGAAGMTLEGADAEQGAAQGSTKDVAQVETMVYVTEGNQLNIQLTNTESNTAKRADIYDVTGKLVKSVRLVEGMNQVELSEASGIFVVRVVRGSQSETHRIFIKK